MDNPIGERIEKLRIEKGWSLRELGKRSHLSHAYISRIEKGETKPSITSLESLAEALKVDLYDLVADEDLYIKKENLPDEVRELGADYVTLAKELKDANILPDTIRDLVKTIKKMTEENNSVKK